MTYCFIGPDPTCDDLECDSRTKSVKVLLSYVFPAAPLILLPCVIAATMAITSQAVLIQEKKLKTDGADAISARIKAQEPTSDFSTHRGFIMYAARASNVNCDPPVSGGGVRLVQ